MPIHYSSLVARYLRRAAYSGWPLAILALLTLIFFWPVIAAGKFIPHGGGDLASFLYPQYSFAAQSIRSGSIPLWNPHLYSGIPFLADNQSGVLYPINLLAFWLFPNFTYQVMEWLVILHIWIAGAAMYACLRMWPGLSPQPLPPKSLIEQGSANPQNDFGRGGAIIGAIAYMFGDVFVTHIGNLNLIAVAAWMPLAFGLFARGLHDRRAGRVAGSSVIFGLALLAGHAQVSVITLIGLGLIALWQIMVAGSWRDRWRVIGLSMLMLVVALGLTAAQILPSIELTRYSLRSGLSYDEATAYSLPPTALASIFSPLLFGRGAIDFWGPWQRVETGYLGVVPLLLMLFAFKRSATARHSEQSEEHLHRAADAVQGPLRQSAETLRFAQGDTRKWFFIALGSLGLLLALGKFTPIYSIFHALPILNGLRVPARFILLTDFSIAALAAMGAQRLRNSEFGMRDVLLRCGTLLFVGIIVLLAAYRSTGDVSHANNFSSAIVSFSVIALIVTVLILWRAGADQKLYLAKASIPILLVIAAAELITFSSTLEIDANNPVAGFDHPQVVDFLHADSNPSRIDNVSTAWQPDAALVNGLDDVGGIFNPLGLANYQTYVGGMGNRGSALYNFLGAKYVLADKGQPPGDASFVPVFNADSSIDVYLNTHARPRVQLIDRSIVVSNGEAAWDAIHRSGFDPSKEVVVQGGENLLGSEDQSSNRSIAFGSISNDRIDLNIQSDTAAYLVISNVYYPGWIASIDDRATEIYPANFAFQAINVPGGSHHVVLQFEPMSWKVGLLLSGLTLAALLFWSMIRWRRLHS